MSSPLELWAATGNAGKLREYQAILQKHPGIQLRHQGELSVYYSPDETGETFVENARIKARSLAAMKSGTWVFAEDSGLMVEGLGGLPGVHSARYAGPHASDGENRAKLLKMMKIRSARNRQAEFYAAIVLLSPQKEEFVFEGRMKGEISEREIGDGGFGYDPVFSPENLHKTLAELSPQEKNQISHRQQAAQAMIEHLSSL